MRFYDYYRKYHVPSVLRTESSFSDISNTEYKTWKKWIIKNNRWRNIKREDAVHFWVTFPKHLTNIHKNERNSL